MLGKYLYASLLAVGFFLISCSPTLAEDSRDDLLKKAIGHWRLGDGAKRAKYPLIPIDT
jgi:hypothetical protein